MRRARPLRRTALKGRWKQTGPAPDVVDAVLERAVWSCERCGCAVGHIRGTDTNLPSNLLLLCPDCHEDIESRRGDALDCGWLVSQLCDPAASAVFLFGDRIRYLTRDGRYSKHPPGESDA